LREHWPQVASTNPLARLDVDPQTRAGTLDRTGEVARWSLSTHKRLTWLFETPDAPMD
jgi:hypothetical protein